MVAVGELRWECAGGGGAYSADVDCDSVSPDRGGEAGVVQEGALSVPQVGPVRVLRQLLRHSAPHSSCFLPSHNFDSKVAVTCLQHEATQTVRRKVTTDTCHSYSCKHTPHTRTRADTLACAREEIWRGCEEKRTRVLLLEKKLVVNAWLPQPTSWPILGREGGRERFGEKSRTHSSRSKM